MGLGLYSTLKHYPTFNEQLQNLGTVSTAQFSLCYGKNSGKMAIGGYDSKWLYDTQEPEQWFNTIDNSAYALQLDKLYVGNVHIPHVPRVGYIDSASLMSYTSYEELEHIIQAFDQF